MVDRGGRPIQNYNKMSFGANSNNIKTQFNFSVDALAHLLTEQIRIYSKYQEEE